MDIRLPDLNGVELTKEMVRQDANVRIVILSFMRTKIPCSAFCDPVRGFVLKRASRGDLMDALRAVARGGSYCSSLISDHIIAQIRRGGSEAGERQPVGSKLTARELEILRLIMTGKSSKEMAVT